MSGAFGFWQPEYAARGLPTFPVRFVLRDGKHDKVPAVAGYMKLGIRGSTCTHAEIRAFRRPRVDLRPAEPPHHC